MFNIFKQKLSSLTLCSLSVFILVLIMTPFSYQDLTVQTAEAQRRVIVVGDRSPAGVLGPIKQAVTAGFSGITAGGISYLVFKEKVLDPLSFNLLNSILAGMLKSLTQWVNSGFQGSPAFVTDLEGYLRDELDEAAGEFLSDSGLDFLCSPFKLDVKIALNRQYANSRETFGRASDRITQCTLSDISNNVDDFLNGSFSDGGWGSWFELTQGPYNDPNKAYLESRERLNIVLRNAKGRELEVLSANKFFKNMEICEEGISANGPIKNCTVTTPGVIIEKQLNDQFASSRRRIEVADEFDELVGALMAQVVNQAFQGLNGLLGLGGSSYTDNRFGSSGQSSYLDALVEEAAEQSAQFAEETNPVGDSIEQQLNYVDLQEQIIELINDVEEKIDTNKELYGSCFGVRMSPELTNDRDDARVEIINSGTIVAILIDFDTRYKEAVSADERLTLVEDFEEFRASGAMATDIDIVQAELDVEFVIPDKIFDLEADITAEANRCQSNLTS